ncbi:hypothetical protein G7Y89_g10642 [Cudoniella acicularis]|uniref:Pectate lyase n=1 Tax=Cudoniella acicularis TaxID=354080 RepID=A0A8H4W0R3_9HELO|nr:hypothetical protein G7Y89_g10642 [Cudoniella acicularis]
MALTLSVTAAPSHPHNNLVVWDCDENAFSSFALKAAAAKTDATSSTQTVNGSATKAAKSSAAAFQTLEMPKLTAAQQQPQPPKRRGLHHRVLLALRVALAASSGTSILSAAQTIAAGASFDGGMVMFDRGVSCTGQSEGGDSDPVFQIENGGSLSNAIIGPNQIEGVHCQGACTLTNVWWSAVCEDAFTVKNQDAGETTKIVGGGAFGADDKFLQRNGAGTISISDFTVETFGKLYRSCGNCKTMYERHVIIDGLTAPGGKEVAGINSNYGDSATITNSKASVVADVCVTYRGTDYNSQEPVENGSGNDGTYCIYGSDVTVS